MPSAKRLTIVIAVAALMLIGLAGAGASTAMLAQPTAVGAVDLQRVFSALTEATAMQANLQSRAEQFEQQREAKSAEIARMRQDLDVIAAGSPAHQQKQDEVKKALIELQVWAQFAQQELQSEFGTQTERLYRRTLDTIAQVAQENGYDAVLYKEAAPNFRYENREQLLAQIQVRKVLFTSDAIDITDQIIQRMNNQYEAGQ